MSEIRDDRQYPQARARLDRLHDALFDLDHAAQTARLRSVFGAWLVPNSPPYAGVTAAIEPYAPLHEPDALAGKSLRLNGAPFATKVVYTIL